MKITVIYGTQRKSCTYHIAKMFIGNLSENDKVSEFFLPKDMPEFCKGCYNCFTDHTKCPDYQYSKPILKSMLESDLLIFTSPVYVYHATGQMKTFLDHFGFMWMSHQPREEMFQKQALIISSAAGAGTKSTVKDIKDSMDFWGIAKTYTYRKNVFAVGWEDISERKKEEIQREAKRLSKSIIYKRRRVNPTFKVKILFYGMRFMHKKFAFNEADVSHWERHGWLDKKRPWVKTIKNPSS